MALVEPLGQDRALSAVPGRQARVGLGGLDANHQRPSVGVT